MTADPGKTQVSSPPGGHGDPMLFQREVRPVAPRATPHRGGHEDGHSHLLQPLAV
jgi:hypothetical protein